jgi:hypothetical protein
MVGSTYQGELLQKSFFTASYFFFGLIPRRRAYAKKLQMRIKFGSGC